MAVTAETSSEKDTGILLVEVRQLRPRVLGDLDVLVGDAPRELAEPTRPAGVHPPRAALVHMHGGAAGLRACREAA